MEARVNAENPIWKLDLKLDESVHDTDIQQQWRKMLEGIFTYVGNDPLLPWLRCIKWVRDAFSYKPKAVDLYKLLETCTKMFQNDEKYRNDIRYLKVWILYADSSQDFEQVYSILEEKGIGRGHSLFYEAYATYLELQRKLCQANTIYLLGVTRQAQPLARLKDMHASFLNRMVELANITLQTKSMRASDANFFGGGKARQIGNVGRDSYFHRLHAEHPIYKLDHGKWQQQELNDKQVQLCNDVSLNASDREEKSSEEGKPRTLSKNRSQVGYNDSQQKRKSRSIISDDKMSDPSSVLVNFEDGILSDVTNVQGKHTLSHPVSTVPVKSTIIVDDRHNHGLQEKNEFSAPVQGIEVHDADVHKMELRICSFKNLLEYPHNQVDAGSVPLVQNMEEDMGDETQGCHPPTVGLCSKDALYCKSSNKAIVANGSDSTGNSLNGDDRGKLIGNKGINPWTSVVIGGLLKRLKSQMLKYNGYNVSAKNYNGKTSLSSLRNAARNKMLDLGGIKYHIKGCSGEGAFGQVFRAHVDGCSEDTVALKIQRPACPWEFYIYRQLDKRICGEERCSFGSAWKIHVYSDCSILVCDYVEHGTLQDVINSYLVTGQCMDEVLCMYYTIEMLRMLEALHSIGLIHGDFKPDNLLIRYGSCEILEDWNPSSSGSWKDQGLCLIDWGRGIDTTLFPSGTEFQGDCKTSGFRCIEMQENRPWTFQVDTYGLCAIAHMMLHGSYMEFVKQTDPEGHSLYRPKAPFKRYWHGELWKDLFTTLLNIKGCTENPDLSILRKGFEAHLSSSSQLRKKLKQLLMKQRTIMCSGK